MRTHLRSQAIAVGNLTPDQLVNRAIKLHEAEYAILEATYELMRATGSVTQKSFRLQILAAATAEQRAILIATAERIEAIHRKVNLPTVPR